ncbi:hypothetical protein [Streptomyces sp. NPDC096339]|uniref:hypothetical protein n=1 Tax=Streptomyces sp. NPDC096339 TaxID=3366086 RepID=UPI0037F9866A
MSKRTNNRHRVATICRRATGLPHHICHRWAGEGLITRTQPVPDAARAAQRAFEAHVVLVLADRLRHEQAGGALLGFTRAEPTSEGLVLTVHPAMADRVVSELLPRLDTRYGGLRGVPGLRLVGGPGRWSLSGLVDDTCIRLVHPDPTWMPTLPGDQADTAYVWRRSPRRPEGIETESPHASWGEARDWLISRLLRRSSLVNEAGAAHGWANTYTHGSRGVVIEWCCAMGSAQMAERLVRSGLTAVPPGWTGDQDPEAGNWTRYGKLQLGEALVTVRQAPCAEQPMRALRGGVR